mgnify:CR=1 FL=1
MKMDEGRRRREGKEKQEKSGQHLAEAAAVAVAGGRQLVLLTQSQ